jgi:hypothetical protein
MYRVDIYTSAPGTLSLQLLLGKLDLVYFLKIKQIATIAVDKATFSIVKCFFY